MKRLAGIELYRCLLTLGIVCLHAVGQCHDKRWYWLCGMFVWCVPGFVFITGYFGSKFRITKILELYGVALYCFIVSNLIGANQLEPGNWIKHIYSLFLDHWFIHAYVGLMMMAPIVNAALALCDSRRLESYLSVFGPFMFFCYVWSFLSNYNCLSKVLPRAPSSQMLTLVGVYVVARVFRLTDIEKKISNSNAAVLALTCVLLSMLRISAFNSIVALGVAVGAFHMCKNIKLAKPFQDVVIFLGPSMFSVFLLHSQPWCYNLMRDSVYGLTSRGIPQIFSFFIVAMAVFVAGIICDLPRRALIGRLWQRF